MSEEGLELIYKIQSSWDKLDVPKFACVSSTLFMLENLVLHPLDVIRTKLQVSREYPDEAIRIIRTSGIRGLYTAYWTSIFYLPGYVAYMTVYCYSRDKLQQIHTRRYPGDGHQVPWVSFVAGLLADVSTVSLYCPVEVVQQRLYLQDPNNKKYNGAIDAFRQIYRKEGITSFYRGMLPVLVNSLPASAIWWTLYESSKAFFSKRIDLHKAHQDIDKHDTVVVEQHIPAQILAGAVAGFFTTLATNPLDVIRTRLQTQHIQSEAGVKYTGTVHAFLDISKKEGYRGFFKGFAMRTLEYSWYSVIGAVLFEFAVSSCTKE
eukprot:TRINITY_DN6654_c0_g2_i4.p1 TRINITY_DN6654_c0_g2~~TRINITY_DN6654_c0_g2_i4.p1  ORF type:complete len:336 (-),score=42.71 TRINITY_DN6654_c0_g2_i4:582-1538(-)